MRDSSNHPVLVYQDRLEAAILLSDELQKYKGQNGVVLAIPRGGVPIGFVVAKELGFLLDVVLIKKLGHPTNEEFAIGSVSLHGRLVDERYPVSQEYIESETRRIQKMLQERYHTYMGNRKPVGLKDRIVIIVDDGIATGKTIMAAAEVVRMENPKKVVIAVPVAPEESIERLKEVADEVICPLVPEDFMAVGQFYRNFSQTEDSEVIELLKKAEVR